MKISVSVSASFSYRSGKTVVLRKFFKMFIEMFFPHILISLQVSSEAFKYIIYFYFSSVTAYVFCTWQGHGGRGEWDSAPGGCGGWPPAKTTGHFARQAGPQLATNRWSQVSPYSYSSFLFQPFHIYLFKRATYVITIWLVTCFMRSGFLKLIEQALSLRHCTKCTYTGHPSIFSRAHFFIPECSARDWEW